jgi:quercetin dioxygenase-like cupin family protein
MSGIEIDLGIKHHFSSGVYAKEMHLPAGHFAVSHKHNFDHLSILAHGSVIVECDGIESQMQGPCAIQIRAGVEHKITAISDSAWFCIHATSETDTSVIDEVLIEKS